MLDALKNRVFEALQSVDDFMHARGCKPGRICRLVGRLEIAYYDRTIDWDNPIYVRDMPDSDSENSSAGGREGTR